MLSPRRCYTTLVLELSYVSLAARLCSVAVLLWISCVSCLSLCVHFTVTVCACARPFVSVYQQDLNGEKGTQSKSKSKVKKGFTEKAKSSLPLNRRTWVDFECRFKLCSPNSFFRVKVFIALVLVSNLSHALVWTHILYQIFCVIL